MPKSIAWNQWRSEVLFDEIQIGTGKGTSIVSESIDTLVTYHVLQLEYMSLVMKTLDNKEFSRNVWLNAICSTGTRP